jgi:hypothetical protein
MAVEITVTLRLDRATRLQIYAIELPQFRLVRSRAIFTYCAVRTIRFSRDAYPSAVHDNRMTENRPVFFRHYLAQIKFELVGVMRIFA